MEIKPLKIGDLVAKIPVIQGGMGIGISLSSLAGAVAAQGGIGIISTAQIGFRKEGFQKNPLETNLEAIKEEIERAKEISNGGIVGVNIMVATRKYEEYVRAAVKAGADLIISGAGLPMTLPSLVEGSSIKLAPIVSSLKSLDVICRYWQKKYNRLPDAVIIEGPKAGGHLGFSLEQLEMGNSLNYEEEIKKIIARVKDLADKEQKEIPVIVAGGIYQRTDMEKALSLGANGVQIATRFVTTYECDASDAYKQTYINAKKEDIVIVKSPVGMPGRAIRNDFIKQAEKGQIPHGRCYQCLSICKPADTPYCITEALINVAEGNVDKGLLFCGENAYRATKIEHVADIMKEFSNTSDRNGELS